MFLNQGRIPVSYLVYILKISDYDNEIDLGDKTILICTGHRHFIIGSQIYGICKVVIQKVDTVVILSFFS